MEPEWRKDRHGNRSAFLFVFLNICDLIWSSDGKPSQVGTKIDSKIDITVKANNRKWLKKLKPLWEGVPPPYVFGLPWSYEVWCFLMMSFLGFSFSALSWASSRLFLGEVAEGLAKKGAAPSKSSRKQSEKLEIHRLSLQNRTASVTTIVDSGDG